MEALKNKWVAATVTSATVAVAVAAVVIITKHYRKLPYAGTYVLNNIDGRQLAQGSVVRMTFMNDEIDIYASCNHMSGTYFVANNKLYWSEQYSTEVGCMPAFAEQDAWLSRWLNGGVHVFRDGKSIVLSANNIKMVLTPASDQELGPIGNAE